MSHNPPNPVQAPSLTGADAGLVRACLLNVVDALNRTVLPELSGGARSRAGECATILQRAAQSLGPADGAVAAELSRLAQYARPLPADQWRAAAELEGAALDQSEAAIAAAAQPAEAAASRTFAPERLERYLRGHALGGEGLKVTSSRVLSGGRSKQTILVQLQGAKALPATVVIRQDWSSAVTGTSVVSEFALLKRVHEAGLRVPQPLLLEKSPEPLGGPFLVVTPMPGGAQGDIFAPPRSEGLALQLAEQVALLHRLPPESFTALDVPTEAYTPEQLRAGLEGFRGLNAKLGFPSRTIEIALDWLERNIDKVKGSKAVLHNDLGFHNFLVDGERLSAILDWELAHIGNPAADLGYIRDWVGQMTSWDRFMEAYRKAGGPEIDAATLDFYTLWCGVRLYCLLLQARAGVAMGMVQDTEITYAVAQFLPKLLHRISRELRAVLAPAPEENIMKVLGGGSVHVYDAVDEGPHKAGPHELWQESVVLLWWDLKQSIGGFYRIGHELNHKDGPMIALWSNTVTPQGVFKKTAYLPLRSQDQLENGFGSGDGSLRYDYDGNCVWTLEDQDIKASLRIHDYHPSIDCYPKKGALSEFAPHHMEVAGRISGSLTAKGVHYEIDALGFRDHGWGMRDWGALLSHRWLAGVFGPELSFCALAWHATDDSMAQFGWVVRNDTVTFAKKLDILAYVEADAMCCRGGRLRIELTTDEVIEVDFEALAPSIMSFHHGIACFDTLCRIRSGELVGIGDFETTHNGQGGKRQPVKLARGGVSQNGWNPLPG